MSKYVDEALKRMKNELETTDQNSLHKEFQNLLDQDFKNRELKENQVINAVVSEITKNYVIVDCKAKMEDDTYRRI